MEQFHRFMIDNHAERSPARNERTHIAVASEAARDGARGAGDFFCFLRENARSCSLDATEPEDLIQHGCPPEKNTTDLSSFHDRSQEKHSAYPRASFTTDEAPAPARGQQHMRVGRGEVDHRGGLPPPMHLSCPAKASCALSGQSGQGIAVTRRGPGRCWAEMAFVEMESAAHRLSPMRK